MTEEARKSLRQRVADLLEQAEKERVADQYVKARHLLLEAKALAEDPGQQQKICEQLALATYKDADLPAEDRLVRAWDYLTDGKGHLPADRQSSETLGLAGAIHKRLWEVSGVRQYLEHSRHYYKLGYEYRTKDGEEAASDTYCGINLAYVLDLLAGLEKVESEKGLGDGSRVEERRDKARRLRRAVIRSLPSLESDPPQKEWWFYATLAEAYFGIGEGAKARACLTQGREYGHPKRWEEESTIRQLASLARAQAVGDDNPDAVAREALMAALGEEHPGAETAHWGKVGLALSGGGFRASLYHLGVLAALAEHDVLRHVEVLSCVSGGSIVGAHYYLKVRELLHHDSGAEEAEKEGRIAAKTDREITAQDYIEVVQKVMDEFCAGITKNIRTRVARNFFKNLAMIFSSRFSRTQRAGDLYDELLYGGPKLLKELLISPKQDADTGQSFHPKYDNWQRRSKVPILVLNATTLNTGHNWQFTATWMGEPPATIDPDVDSVRRLRRMYHEEAPPRHQSVRLGQAVAASACVPGLFEPLELAGLYPKHTVRLVDGGVHDNQGVAGLLEQDCQVVLVSDASGQMDLQADPSRGPLGVPLRSNSILMARVRSAELADLRARRQSERLRGLLFVHLKQGLREPPVNWIGCEKPETLPETLPDEMDEGRFRIDPSIQTSLAKIRTDLDSFSEVEAQALMLSGYEMTKQQLERGVGQLNRKPVVTHPWPFLQMRKLVEAEKPDPQVARLLAVGSQRAFKIWRLVPWLKWAGLGTCLGAAALGWWLLYRQGDAPLLTFGAVASFLFTLAAAAAVAGVAGKVFGRWLDYVKGILTPRNLISRVALGVLLAMGGWILAFVHLWVFDRWFLSRGKMSRFVKPEKGATGPAKGGAGRPSTDLDERESLSRSRSSKHDTKKP